MSLLRMMEGKLPPGFRFHPRDDELVCDYLAKKTNISSGDGSSVITFFGFPPILLDDVDLNKCEPWDLPEMSCVGGKEWYFFNLRDRKYATGQRTNRATATGYWKATGKDRHITRKGMLVGMRKTLVFYQGRAPKGKKTDWVMHEFRMENKPAGDDSKYIVKEDWVLCRIFYKSRGLPSKPSMETSATCSSSLPPPPKETYITFGLQTPMSLEGYEQVPCFSNNAFPVSTPLAMAVPYDVPLVVERSTPKLPEFGVEQLDCDKKVITAVLNHLTKFDGNMQKREALTSLGEGNFNTYYLCENGLSSVW